MVEKEKKEELEVWGWQNHVVEGKYRLVWTLVGLGASLGTALYWSPVWLAWGFWPWCKTGGGIQYTDPWEGFQTYLTVTGILFVWLGITVVYIQGRLFLKPGSGPSAIQTADRFFWGIQIGWGIGAWYVASLVSPLSLEYMSHFLAEDGVFLPKAALLWQRFFQLWLAFLLVSLFPILWIVGLIKPLQSSFPKETTFWNDIPAWTRRAKARRWFWLGLLILGAICTPPDLFSQMAIVFPFVGMVEGIWWWLCLRVVRHPDYHFYRSSPEKESKKSKNGGNQILEKKK